MTDTRRVKCCIIIIVLLVQSFTARMPLRMATSAFRLGRRRWNPSHIVIYTVSVPSYAILSPPVNYTNSLVSYLVHLQPWNQLIALPMSSTSLAFPVIGECHSNSIVRIRPGQSPQNWLSWQRPLQERKTNFTSFIYSHSSTKTENLAKIGAADEIIGLTEIVKK